jgi:hypothetical protein
MVASHNRILEEQVLDFARQLTPTVDDCLAKSQGKTRFFGVHYPDLSLVSARRCFRCVPVLLIRLSKGNAQIADHPRYRHFRCVFHRSYAREAPTTWCRPDDNRSCVAEIDRMRGRERTLSESELHIDHPGRGDAMG